MPKTYKRLMRNMKWVAILADSEVEAAIAAYKRGDNYACEAVSHYGGPRKVIQRAVEMRERLRDMRERGVIA